MKTFEFPYIRAVESPLIKLMPSQMRDVVFKRNINIEFDLNIDNLEQHMEKLQTLCRAHYIESEGYIKKSKIAGYNLHLATGVEGAHDTIELPNTIK